jgi:FkbM family methyltransferase
MKKIKYYIKVLLGKELFFRKDLKINLKWFGNEHAGFYLNPAYLSDNSIVYSFGVGTDISFDQELIAQYNCIVFGFDPTPKTIDFIANYAQLPKKFIFEPYGLYTHDGTVAFFLPENPNHVSCTVGNIRNYDEGKLKKVDVPVLSFDSILKKLGHKTIDVLKLDIEGSEYDVLDDILNAEIQINQICIEFHHRFKGVSVNKTKHAIKRLRDKGYLLIGISPQAEEYTFINSNFISN